MKIQLSPVRIIKDAMTVWHEHGPDVDVVMDLKNLSFAPGSIHEIYSFHVLEQLFPDESQKALSNWFALLAPAGRMFVVVDDFEYICRAFMGGDMTIDLLNRMHNHATQFSRESLGDLLHVIGFKEGNVKIWLDDVPELFLKNHYELILEAHK